MSRTQQKALNVVALLLLTPRRVGLSQFGY